MPRRRPALLPSWISEGHPLYLNSEARSRIRQEFHGNSGIFLNIPYSDRYSNLEVATISTVTAYGLTPRMARERVRLEVRAQKIFELILSCRYGFTDLSYQTRMNMPLELGLLLALGKETFVTSKKRYSSLKSISDLNFGDIHYHGGSVRTLIKELSRWIEQTCSTKQLTTKDLLKRYRMVYRFRNELGEDFDKRLPQLISRLLRIFEQEFKAEIPRARAL